MSDTDQGATTAARERSTVEFPYADLSEATTIVRVIHSSGGMPMDRDQIAARLDQKPTSGAFTTKISAARMFQLVEVVPGSGKIQITPLGHEVIAPDDSRQRTAKAEAFLNVELYRKLYDEFRNRHLPPRPNGLEQAMVGMGVAPKQRTNARYAFDRSAKQAGYFEHGIERLVAPVGMAPTSKDAPPANDPTMKEEDQPPTLKLDGVITALIDKLPVTGPWTGDKRAAWLKMMAMAFDMAYEPLDPGITISVSAPSEPKSPPMLKPVAAPSGGGFQRGGGSGPKEAFPADLDDEIPF
jgi:hypothetical protein